MPMLCQQIKKIITNIKDKIIIIENGTVAAIGNHEELLKNNKIYQELYFTQNKTESAEGGEK